MCRTVDFCRYGSSKDGARIARQVYREIMTDPHHLEPFHYSVVGSTPFKRSVPHRGDGRSSGLHRDKVPGEKSDCRLQSPLGQGTWRGRTVLLSVFRCRSGRHSVGCETTSDSRSYVVHWGIRGSGAGSVRSSLSDDAVRPETRQIYESFVLEDLRGDQHTEKVYKD